MFLIALVVKNKFVTKGVIVTTKPDYSKDRTIQHLGETVTVNFEKCTPDVASIGVPFGSTTIEIKGKEGAYCRMNTGGEVENPEWDGKLTTTCSLPVSLSTMTFGKTQYGVDFTQIQSYCKTL